ncbi:uncharacterized protein M6B38_330645 [Iris pallida]|uniref:Uncharacterized protein n=1 Tax=Iris pallida TaxID=29817 RepID=A0AAX6H3T3_IRIPA|nr:uncharacterized protein M6B38_330645 [Iris pallida]
MDEAPVAAERSARREELPRHRCGGGRRGAREDSDVALVGGPSTPAVESGRDRWGAVVTAGSGRVERIGVVEFVGEVNSEGKRRSVVGVVWRYVSVVVALMD